MFENHTGSRHEPLRVRGCSPAWVAASQGVWFQGTGHGSLHKDMESSPDNARGNRPSPGEIWTIPADLSQLKTCHGHLHPYYKFKRKSLFKPKSQECSSPECPSRLVAPHQEPFAPMLKITPVRVTNRCEFVAAPRPGWPRARASGFRGQGTDRSTKTWNHLQTMPEGIDQALAKSGQSRPIYLNSKPAMGTSTHTINTLFKRKSLFKPKSQECLIPRMSVQACCTPPGAICTHV